MESDIKNSWDVFYENNFVSPIFKTVTIRDDREYDEIMYQLWVKHLISDKRSFREYFIEEHGFDIGENISIEALTKLCELIK